MITLILHVWDSFLLNELKQHLLGVTHTTYQGNDFARITTALQRVDGVNYIGIQSFHLTGTNVLIRT